MKQQISKMKGRMNQFTEAQERLSKKIFSNKQGLYTEKPNAKSKEQIALEEEQAR